MNKQLVQAMVQTKHSNFTFLMGYLVLFMLMGLLLWPYLHAVIFAGILTGAFHSTSHFLIKRLGMNTTTAAGIICVLIVTALFVPIVFLTKQLSSEAFTLYQQLKVNLTEEVLEDVFFGEGYIPRLLQDLFTILDMDYNVTTLQGLILDTAKSTSTYVFDTINGWISNIFVFLFQFLIMLVVVFSLISEGEAIKQFFLELSPLPNDEEELVIKKFNQMNYVSLVGNGLGGCIQGGLAVLGFWWVGIDSLLLWMTVMIILAFIPLVGISIIYVPACLYLYFNDRSVDALVLFSWCTFISLVVENWFKPRFVGDRVKINSTLVFLSIIGGLNVFGLVGIFYGPLIISIFLTFVNLYHKRYSEDQL